MDPDLATECRVDGVHDAIVRRREQHLARAVPKEDWSRVDRSARGELPQRFAGGGVQAIERVIVVASHNDGLVACHAQRGRGPDGKAGFIAPHATAAIEGPGARQGGLTRAQLDGRLVLGIAAALRPNFTVRSQGAGGQHQREGGSDCAWVHADGLSLGRDPLALGSSVSLLARIAHTSTTFKADVEQ